MNKNIELSIVVLVLNRPRLLRYCIESVLKNTCSPFEIVLWDNGSTMPEVFDYMDSLKEKYPDIVKIYKSETNLGCGIGRAYALEKASGTFLCTLDSDMNVTAGWDLPLLKMLKDDPTIAAVCSKIVNPDNRLYGNGGRCREIGAGYIVLENIDAGKNLIEPCSPSQDCDWLPGGAMVFRRDVYEAYPYSKSRYKNHLDDIPFCFKARNAGWRLVNCPTSVMYHFSTSLEHDQRKEYYAMRASRAVYCQSLLYLEDDLGFNSILSWGGLRYINKENPTLLQLTDYFSGMREYLRQNNGISTAFDGATVYSENVIEAYVEMNS